MEWMGWVVAQANACCGEFIERVSLPVLAVMVLGPGFVLLGFALRVFLRRAGQE